MQVEFTIILEAGHTLNSNGSVGEMLIRLIKESLKRSKGKSKHHELVLEEDCEYIYPIHENKNQIGQLHVLT